MDLVTPVIKTVAFRGVDVQAQISSGLPAFTIVGSNPDVGSLLRIIFLVLFSAIALYPSGFAYALSCPKDDYSIEGAFIGADAVFSGDVIGNNEDGSALVLVGEYYKKTNLEGTPQEVKIFDAIRSQISLPAGAEVIIYGSYKKGNPNEIVVSACGKSKLSPNTIRLWAEKSEKYEQKLENLGEVLLFGRVLEAKHKRTGHDYERSKSEIKMKIQNILFHEADKIELAKDDLVDFHIAPCGEEMKVDHEYIVSAKLDKLRAENGVRLTPPKDILTGYCTSIFPMDMGEKETLRKLSKLNRQQ